MSCGVCGRSLDPTIVESTFVDAPADPHSRSSQPETAIGVPRVERRRLAMRISRASVGDVTSVVALLDEAAAWQRDRGIDMWQPRTFGAEVRQVADAGDLYVARSGG